MSRSAIPLWLGSVACSCLAACALFSKAEPMTPRYFTPEGEVASPASLAPASASLSRSQQLRLGSVRGGSQLRERIMFRSSAHELGYYEDRRWTERPEVYLRRALGRELFEARGLVRVISGSAPTLEAELVAFEELLGPPHGVRVQVTVTLDDDRTGSWQETITVEEPAPIDANHAAADATVDALATALRKCVAQIAERVLLKLSASAATAVTPS